MVYNNYNTQEFIMIINVMIAIIIHEALLQPNLANVEMTESTDFLYHVHFSGLLLHLPDDLHLAVHAHQFILSGSYSFVNG